jgi:hypothetical protein
VCVAALNSWCKLQGLTSVTNMAGGVCKPNVTRLRYRREWGTWPARDARTVNPNVRFKTWGLGTLGTGLAGPEGDEDDCPRFASQSSFSPPSHHYHLHCLSASLSHPTTPQRSRMKLNMSHIHQEPQEPSCYIVDGVVCGGLAAELRPPHLVWLTLSTHTPITNSKFGCICNTNTRTSCEYDLPDRGRSPPLQSREGMSMGRRAGGDAAVPRE